MTNTSTTYDQGVVEGHEAMSYVVRYDDALPAAAEIAADRFDSEADQAQYIAGFNAGVASYSPEEN